MVVELKFQSEDMYKLLSHVYSRSHFPNRERRVQLEPEELVRDASQELNLTINDNKINFIASVIQETMNVSTNIVGVQKQRADQRINKSLDLMRRAFNLQIIMFNVMFYVGVLLVSFGVISVYNGREITGLLLGGVGLTDIALFFIKEPIKGIHESIGNIMQLRAAYNSYFEQLDQWKLYYDYQFDQNSIAVKRKAADIINRYTETTLEFIQKYCESTQNNLKNEEVI